MNKSNLKRILTCFIAVFSIFIFSACNNNIEPQSKSITKEEYIENLLELSDILNNTDYQNFDKIFDTSNENAEEREEFLNEFKKPYTEFIEIIPPQDFENVHEKFKSSFNSFLDCFDIASDIKEKETEQELMDILETVNEKIQIYIVDFAEGIVLLYQHIENDENLKKYLEELEDIQ